ncbi:hypothetical protein AB0H88_47045 [Nonomuraea sp. NPDC050680]|uniref:hypothetical protein n=1 Tax=Nonomuraea sp. NPDC050680 TaxID=3154630 RepID=UPI0033F8ADB9
MSPGDHEQPGGAEPAIYPFVPLLSRGPAKARREPSTSEPGGARRGLQRVVEVSA